MEKSIDSSRPKLDDLLEERRCTNDLRWASRDWDSCPYFVREGTKSPSELIDAVLNSQSVNKVIEEICLKNGESREKVFKEAQEIMSEMAHNFQMYAIRWFGLVLSKTGKHLYNSIQVDVQKIEKIKQAYSSYPVVLLPTHRSYVDFLLVSFLSFSYELSLPVIAAGMDFRGMVGVGEMLRRSGAFFIRRTFGNDCLYWALIEQYVKISLLEGGHPLEMFLEGTRSRSGKSLMPKTGLLNFVLQLVYSGQISDILLVPISMSYDRTLEEKLYAHELLGKPKPKESTNGLMKALRWLNSQSYGSVYVNFGNILSVRQMLGTVNFVPNSILSQEVIRRKALDIAKIVIIDQQNHLLVPIFSAISLIVLSKISRGIVLIPYNELLLVLNSLHAILKAQNMTFGLPLQSQNFESNVRFIISTHSALVSLQSGSELVLLINFNEAQSDNGMIFQHYANQILHAILPLAIKLLIDESKSSLNKDKENGNFSTSSIAEFVFLRQLLDEEFPCLLNENGQTQIDEYSKAQNIYSSLESLHSKDLDSVTIDNEGKFSKSLILPLSLDVIRKGLEPILIGYWGVSANVLQLAKENSNKGLEMKELTKSCQDYIRVKMKENIVSKQFGALSLDTLNNSIYSLIRQKALSKIKLKNSSIGIEVADAEILKSIHARINSILVLENLRTASPAASKTYDKGNAKFSQIRSKL